MAHHKVSWSVRTEPDNRGRPLDIWSYGDYELSENVNLGLEGGWVYELTLRNRFVALCANLREGKRWVAEREQAAATARSPLGLLESMDDTQLELADVSSTAEGASP